MVQAMSDINLPPVINLHECDGTKWVSSLASEIEIHEVRVLFAGGLQGQVSQVTLFALPFLTLYAAFLLAAYLGIR